MEARAASLTGEVSAPDNPFYGLVQGLRRDRVKFVETVLGVKPVRWQAEELAALDRGCLRLSIRSGHGVGKSTFLAWVMLHELLTCWPVKIVATAPSAPQLFDALASEVKRWVKELPEALGGLLEVSSDRISLRSSPTEAFISFRTSRAETPEALQGVHALHTLLIADEASGVPEPIFESASGSMSTPGAITILTGNPTRSFGFFYWTHTKWSDKWRCRRVSCFDSEMVDPGFVREMRERYGVDSNQYRIRVLGEFPDRDEESFIPRELVSPSLGRDIEDVGAGVVWGLDVARFGSAASVLCKRRGKEVLEFRKWRNLDLMQLVGAVKVEFDNVDDAFRPVEIFVDAIGLGAGVSDRMRELGLPAVAVNVSESPSTVGTYMRLRDELWGRMRQWFESRVVRMPSEEWVVEELIVPRVIYTSTGKLQLESKADMMRRGFASPDGADALALTFAHDGAAALGMVSRGWERNVNEGMSGGWYI